VMAPQLFVLPDATAHYTASRRREWGGATWTNDAMRRVLQLTSSCVIAQFYLGFPLVAAANERTKGHKGMVSRRGVAVALASQALTASARD